jgi:hypothetical protein
MGMMGEDEKVQEFLRGMERLSEDDRNYISSLTRSLFLIENPALMPGAAGAPVEIPKTGSGGITEIPYRT